MVHSYSEQVLLTKVSQSWTMNGNLWEDDVKILNNRNAVTQRETYPLLLVVDPVTPFVVDSHDACLHTASGETLLTKSGAKSRLVAARACRCNVDNLPGCHNPFGH